MDYQKICKNCGDKQGWHYSKTKKDLPICHGTDCTCEAFV